VTPPLAVPVFLLSLVVTLAAAQLFARRLDRVGTRLGLPEVLIGLLTALAADGPEISSALVALAKGKNSVSAGVLVGSNVFNLAAMIGLSALLVGVVRLPRETLLLEGAASTLATVFAVCVLIGLLPAIVGALLIVAVLAPYLLLLIRGQEVLAHVPSTEHQLAGLSQALTRSAERRRRVTPVLGLGEEVLFIVDVALIVAGSFGMVQAALALGDHWKVSDALIGVLVLAPLTSVPNALTALRLGLAGRGSALVSETFNSNTINVVVGIAVPALFVSIVNHSAIAKFDVAWLLAMTAVCLVFLARPGGMRRLSAVLLISMYLGFVAVQLLYE